MTVSQAKPQAPVVVEEHIHEEEEEDHHEHPPLSLLHQVIHTLACLLEDRPSSDDHVMVLSVGDCLVLQEQVRRVADLVLEGRMQWSMCASEDGETQLVIRRTPLPQPQPQPLPS
jgi:hypothetical protein